MVGNKKKKVITTNLKCKPSAHAQLLAHSAWLVAWAMGTIINTHAHG